MLENEKDEDIVSHLYMSEGYYFNPKILKRHQVSPRSISNHFADCFPGDSFNFPCNQSKANFKSIYRNKLNLIPAKIADSLSHQISCHPLITVSKLSDMQSLLPNQ